MSAAVFQHALRMARLCQRAYGDEALELDGQYALIDSDAKGMVIAWRGSADLKDWLTDSRFFLSKGTLFPGKVHSGFREAAAVALQPLAGCVPRDMPVHLTGHSLGAALATLAAWYLAGCHGIKIASITTFGSPRVGDHAFADAFTRSPLPAPLRVVNYADWVAHNPLPPLYWHVGQILAADAEGLFHDGDTAPWPWLWDWKWHGIDRYIEVLEKAAAVASQAAA